VFAFHVVADRQARWPAWRGEILPHLSRVRRSHAGTTATAERTPAFRSDGAQVITLYHYCCSCSARRITQRGFLRPAGRELFGVHLVWLTDQAVRDRSGLGLTCHEQPCDRLAFQYVVHADAGQVVRWLDSAVRAQLALVPEFIAGFEGGRTPAHWWIAPCAVFAVRSRTYRNPDPITRTHHTFRWTQNEGHTP